MLTGACEGPETRQLRTPMAHEYGRTDDSMRCERLGAVPDTREETGGWKLHEGPIHYLVKAPVNYDATRRHPLLVVFSPAGASAEDSERFTRLTPLATRKGFVVAYVAHRPMSLANVKAQAAVLPSLMGRWCIDPDRVFFAGHSDGGTVSTVLAVLPETRGTARGIAVSAAGILPMDTQAMGCPASPMKVWLMHGQHDAHFPGYGQQMARWWSQCFRCDGEGAAPDARGCRRYADCGANELEFCEGPHGHLKWPGLESEMLDFFLAQRRIDSRGRE